MDYTYRAPTDGGKQIEGDRIIRGTLDERNYDEDDY